MKQPDNPLPTVIPKCWDSREDWDAWNDLNKRCADMLGPSGKRVNYCTDCTPEYKRSMELQNRCGHPETKFISIAGTKQFIGRR